MIHPGKINGTLNAPPSKSIMQRAVAAALLSEGITRINNPSYSDDSTTALKIIGLLGASININNEYIEIKGCPPPSYFDSNSRIILNCRESGLGLRLFSTISCLYPGYKILTGLGSLMTRPVTYMENTFKDLNIKFKSSYGFIPIELDGIFKGGKARIDGSFGSQLISGFLMALPLVENDSELIVTNPKSKPYIDLTLEILDRFGIEIENNNYESFKTKGKQKYNATEITVEGDWSGAAFMLVAGAICGEIKVTGLNPNSSQADKKILDVLKKVGATISLNDKYIIVKKNNLIPFEFDASDCPDLFPPLTALASACNGKSIIIGANRLQYKESSRATVLKTEFEKLGSKIIIDNDAMIIHGGNLQGGKASSNNDHRITMSLAVAGLIADNPVTIEGTECVCKSYPNFFEELNLMKVS